MSLPARLLVLVILLAACTTAAPSMTEEARCRQSGGMWRNDYCDPAGGGGAGY
jgi:hypothetical protein